MSESNSYEVKPQIAKNALIDEECYQAMYRQSLEDPEGFWAKMADDHLDWFKKWDRVSNWSFQDGVSIRWFEGGKLNVSWNCLDRHLEERGEKIAILWEGDQPGQERRITFKELHGDVCRFANVLKSRGVRKGDRVCIYMPMVPEAAVAMLACARIGAVHSVVFGGFSPDALRDRIIDSDCRIVITADEGPRGGKNVPLKGNTHQALESCPDVGTCIVLRRTGGDIPWREGRDIWYHEAMENASAECAPEEMDAEDPLFILYTSGSTGKPKGVQHSQAGYLLYTTMTFRYVFDYHEGDVFWCTADVGWVTGHSYVVYSPLSNGATTLMFEGVPNYPDHSRFWEVCDRHRVNIFYTAPTAIRALMGQGNEFVTRTERKSLRILGSVGEPINPEAWEWYYRIVGEERCPIVDTWWQTETGGILIAPLPGCTDLKPGSATRPFFGVEPVIVDNEGKELSGAAEGALCIKRSWPGQMRTVFGDHERFVQTYFSTFENLYMTGDGARRDDDGYYWITGRVDDVINVSGHRMGTAEVESALVLHPDVAEAAVVGYPHPIKGQGIYAYITLNTGVEQSDELEKSLVQTVRKEIGPIASPDLIQFAPGLPKTRSGKIMRRILRKVAMNEIEELGDTSTLAEPAVVDDIIENRRNR
ncbi:acetate--CoA ligase [Thioalkalivibrio sp. HK1]|uniref:acetate--CoA ligase n=1 Tax=Thioalkalivibrio sp. HK1 TaxID=1469245 RepID=UPI00047092C2|nr:acetate--CoA ligase [Thioalkalivibrio sp. HK1]